MNDVQAAKIHAALQITLKKFAEEHGLVCRGANTKWSAEGLRTGIIEFKEKDVAKAEADVRNTANDPRFMTDFYKKGWQLGLTNEMLNKEYTLESREGLGKFVLIGMRASKLVMKGSDGKLTVWRDAIASKVIAQFKAM